MSTGRMNGSQTPYKTAATPEYDHSSAGFTLIEVAIIMMVASILLIPLLRAYDAYIDDLKGSDTKGALNDVEDALKLYAQQNDGYPLPASLARVEGDPLNGTEGNPAPLLCSNVAWFATDGMCITADAEPILIGAVPFQALGLREDQTLDYWDRKLIYAVTQNLTANSGTFSVTGNNGNITIMSYDATRTLVVEDPDVDAIVISTGETGKGGYTNQAVQTDPCINAIPEVEDENCDLDSVFVIDKSDVTGEGSRSIADNNDFYDDYTKDIRSIPVDRWYEHPMNPGYAMTRATYVGIGTSDPQYKIDVAGDTLVETQLQTPNYCNDDASSCFSSDSLADTSTDAFDCGVSGTPHLSVAVDAGQLLCADAVNGSGDSYADVGFDMDFMATKNDNCPAGELVKGFDSVTGNIICETK